jgi:hypothetical protein
LNIDDDRMAMHSASRYPTSWITLKDAKLCEEIKSAFPSLEELEADNLLMEVQPHLDEIEEMVDSKALETDAEQKAFLSLVQHPETWVRDTLLPRPLFVSAGQQEAFLNMMQTYCYWIPEHEESTTEAPARGQYAIQSVSQAGVP